jgi:hypothetical protein
VLLLLLHIFIMTTTTTIAMTMMIVIVTPTARLNSGDPTAKRFARRSNKPHSGESPPTTM